jgi:hypothetical protein
MSFTVETASPPLTSSGAIQLYAYEPFSYRFVYPSGHTAAAAPFSNTSVGLLSYLAADVSGVTFAGTPGTSYSTAQTLTLVDSAGSTYSNTVAMSPGRFTTNFSGSNLIFYANEPMPSIQLYSVANLDPATAYTQPTLPSALRFTAITSNRFDLSGLPAATSPATTYQFVASNSNSQVVSIKLNIQTMPERVQLLGGPLDVSLSVGVPFTTTTFTATEPLTASNLYYSLPGLPSGLTFTDINGTVQSGATFYPPDALNTLKIVGTPTIDTPSSLARSGSSNTISNTLTARATSVFSGAISASTSLMFHYNRTVLFTQPTNNAYLPTLIDGLPVPTTDSYRFNAQSVFGTGGNKTIVNVYSPNLRSDLSFSTVDGAGNAYLTGTPVTADSNTYTAIAVDSSGNTGSIVFGVSTVEDVVTLSPFVDTCLNFVIGRPVSNVLPGYYSSNLTLTATSSARLPITFSAPVFERSGITVTTTSSTVTLSGIPTTLTPLTTAYVTASDTLKSAVQSVGFAVLDDVFTWYNPVFAFEQNRVVIPVQLSVTTLSGRTISSFTAVGLPSGVMCTRNGLIQGTCYGLRNGTFTVTASTGISTHAQTFSYTIALDNILLVTPADSYSLVPGATIPTIPLVALAYSGNPVTSLAVLQPSYGITLSSSNIGGTLYSGDSPQFLYPSVPIVFTGQVGPATFSNTYTLESSRYIVNGMIVGGSNAITKLYTLTTASVIANAGIGPTLTGSPQVSKYFDFPTTNISDLQLNSSNAVVASLASIGLNGSTVFGDVVFGNSTGTLNSVPLTITYNGTNRWYLYRSAFSVAYSGTGNTWYALGLGYNENRDNQYGSFSHIYLLQSDNNGQTWTPGYSSTTTTNWALAVQARYALSNMVHTWTDFFVGTKDFAGYNTGAVVLRRDPVSGIYMAGGGPVGGHTMLRITSMTTPAGTGDQATIVPTKSVPSGDFASETRDFSLDATPWVAAGSSMYSLYVSASWSTAASTLRWSTDQGATWQTGSGDFTYIGLEIAYGSNRWLAIGQDIVADVAVTGVKTSVTGKSWTSIALPSGVTLTKNSTIAFTNSQWIVNIDGSNFMTAVPTLTGGFTQITSPVGDLSHVSPVFQLMNPLASNSLLRTSHRDLSIQLSAPTLFSYAIMQYTTLAPIVLTPVTPPVFFFVDATTIPRGIQFDSLTGTFTGLPVLLGSTTVRIYVTAGTTAYNYFDFTFNVYSPYQMKRQDMASAYTAYVRQEAVIAGAQFSRDSIALPSETTTVGAAMGPAPPENTSAPVPCCK